MIEIVNVYKQDVPAARFIGKCYGDADRVDGGYGARWEEWNENGWLAALESHIESEGKLDVEDGDAYVGLMRWKEGEPFQYWIGMFAAAGTAVPEGYSAVDFPSASVGICWLRGREPEIYKKEMMCAERLQEAGYRVIADEEQAYWFFERYGKERFKEDAEGITIVDIGHFVESQPQS